MHPFVFSEPVLAQVSPPPTPSRPKPRDETPPEGDITNFRYAKIGLTINSQVSNGSGLKRGFSGICIYNVCICIKNYEIQTHCKCVKPQHPRFKRGRVELRQFDMAYRFGK
jgi:hypothetical protein